MKETGRILRAARESQNISLAAVSAVTKINVKVLEAIENAHMESLPSKTFLRGFVQTYASFLKLSSDEVLENFQKEMGTTKYTPAVNPNLADGQPAPEAGATPTESAPSNGAGSSSNISAMASQSQKREDDEGLAYANGGRSMISKIVFAGIAALLLVGIYVVSEVVQKYQKESQVGTPPADLQSNAISNAPIKNPADDQPNPTGTTDPKLNKPTDSKTAAGVKAEPKLIEKIEPKPAVTEVKPVEKVAEKPPEKATEKTPEKPADKPVDKAIEKPSDKVADKPIAAKPADVKPPEVKPEVKADLKLEAKPDAKPPETPATAEVKPAVPLNPQEVVLEALDSVKVDYRIDGGALQSVTLQPEEKRSFKAKREIKIDVSDGGAVSVSHNGKDRGVPGNLGQSMKLSFP